MKTSSGNTRALRNRDYRVFLSAHLIGSLGDSMMYLAAGIWVQKLTGSNASAALTFLFALLPALISPLAGAIVDRIPRRRALILLNLVGGVCVLPMFLATSADHVWLIYAVMFLNGLVSMGIQPAQSAQLAELADATDLPAMNGILRTCLETFKLVSPAVGAGLFVLAGPYIIVAIDSLTSFIAAGLLVLLPKRDAPVQPAESSGFIVSFLDGFKFIIGDPSLRRLTLISVLFMAVAGISESLRWSVVTEGLGATSEWMGPLQMVMGIGSIICGLVASTLVGRLGSLRAMGIALCLFGGGSLLWTTSMPAAIFGGAIIVGAGSTMLVIAALVLLQQRTAHHLQGKVFTAFELLTTGPQLASIAAGAYIITIADYRIAMAALALVSLSLALLAALSRVGERSRSEQGPL